MKSPYIVTCTGKNVSLTNPLLEDISTHDIAHSLSRINRFNGHTKGEPYSVAQHSVMVAELVEKRYPNEDASLYMAALLHDAHEAYVGDISTPVKKALSLYVPDQIAELSALFDIAIEQSYELDFGLLHDDRIKEADLSMLAAEKNDLMVSCGNWDTLEGVRFEDVDRITPLHWSSAKELFLLKATYYLGRY